MKRWRFLSSTIMVALCLLLPVLNLSAQDGCSLQAGEDFSICFDDAGFTLSGTHTGPIDSSTVVWIGPAGFNILSPNTFETDVVPTGLTFPTGTFEFYLSAECETGGRPVDTIEVTVLGEATTPIIHWNGVPEDGPIQVCNSVTLTGNAPGPGEIAGWTILEAYDITRYQIEESVNRDTFTFTNVAIQNGCNTFTIVYNFSNGGCTRHDTIEVEIIQQNNPVILIQPHDNQRLCADTLRFWGTHVGCHDTARWTFLNTPNGLDPAVVLHAGDYRYIDFDFTVSGTGWYTVEYHIPGNGPCPAGSDTTTVFICVADLLYGDSRTTLFLCDGFPLTGSLENPNPAAQDAGCTPMPWRSNPGPPTVTIVGNTYTIDPLNVPLSVSFTQEMDCGDSCVIAPEDTVDCNPVHTHVIATGPEFDFSGLDTILLSCGGDPQFVPWQHVSYQQPNSIGHTFNVLVLESSPDNPYVNPGDAGGLGYFANLSIEGEYLFRFIITGSVDGVRCRDTTFLRVIVQTLSNPSAGVVSGTLCLGDTVQLDGSNPNGPADILWTQLDNNDPITFIPSQFVSEPFIVPLEVGNYQLEYTYSQMADCYLADTLVFEVVDCDTCDITTRFWVKDINCVFNDKCKEEYEVTLMIYDPNNCHQNFTLVSDIGQTAVSSTFYDGEILVVQALLTDVPPGEEVCFEVTFDNDASAPCELFCPVKACVETPKCICGAHDFVYYDLPKCIEPFRSYCFKVEFQYCGENGFLHWTLGPNSSAGLSIDYQDNGNGGEVNPGLNSWEICISTREKCDGEVVVDLLGDINDGKCFIEDEFKLKCCCKELRWEYRRLECSRSGYIYELVIYDGWDCGEFTLTSNGNEPSLFGYSNENGNLVINGYVDGLTTPGSLCVEIDYHNEACCDIKACKKLPCCCHIAPLVEVDNINCVLDENGDPTYEFVIKVGNPNGWSENYQLTASCGDVSSTWVNDGGFIIVSGIITNVTGAPGEDCCFNFEFPHCELCDVERCVELPPCECLDSVSVTYPDCIRPGEEFCVTYDFFYYGPPTTGVWAEWSITTNTSTPGWTMTSPSTQNPVNFGQNSWEVCLEYDGECLEEIDLVIKAYMFYGNNIQCCSIRDERILSCCCDCDVEIVYCADDGGLTGWKTELSDEKYARDEAVQKWLEKERGRSSGCAPDPCCPICEEPDYEGPLVAQKPGGMPFPDYFTYLWNTGATTPIIIGTSPGTYSVTVTDPVTGCEYETEVEVLCNLEGLKEDGRLEQSRETSADLIEVFPVPTKGQINLKGELLKGSQIIITSLDGEELNVIRDNKESERQLNLSNLTSGIYYIKVLTTDIDHPLIVKKIVVTK